MCSEELENALEIVRKFQLKIDGLVPLIE